MLTHAYLIRQLNCAMASAFIAASIEASAEEAATTAVETVVENAVEDTVEETVENGVENVVEEVSAQIWTGVTVVICLWFLLSKHSSKHYRGQSKNDNLSLLLRQKILITWVNVLRSNEWIALLYQVVENAVENSVEEGVTDAVEEAVEEAVGEAVSSSLKKQLLIFIAGKEKTLNLRQS